MDIAVTWPNDRPLKSYLGELQRAHRAGEHAYFRLPSRPSKLEPGDKVFRVHSGRIRGWLVCGEVVEITSDERIIDNVTGLSFRPGIYAVCDAEWHPHPGQVELDSFRGFKYVDWRVTEL